MFETLFEVYMNQLDNNEITEDIFTVFLNDMHSDYINNNNNCECLTYSITTNEWSDSTTYINSCLSKKTSLILDYYDISNNK